MKFSHCLYVFFFSNKAKTAVSARCVAPPPGSDEVQQMLPTFADFVEFMLDLGGFVVLAGLGQALAHGLQLLLVLLSHTDLFLVVLERRRQRGSEPEVVFPNVKCNSIELHTIQKQWSQRCTWKLQELDNRAGVGVEGLCP